MVTEKRGPLFLGCDIGTSGTKTVVVDQSGHVLAQARRGYGIISKQNQWAEQWPQVWMDAMLQTIAEVTEQVDAKSIASVCISALYGGTGVLCDRDMRPLRPAIIWMDRRAVKEKAWIDAHITEEKIFQRTGNGTDTYFGFTKLLWVKENEPEIWAKVHQILPVHSYLVYELTGQVTTDYSAAGNLGGIYHYKAHTWDRDMAATLGISMCQLPEKLGAPYETAGLLTDRYAERTGLPKGVPVCFGTVDCIASMLSAGVVAEGDNAAVLGTSLNWGFIHRQQPSDKNLVSMPYAISPREISYTYGGASTAGALPRWFLKDILCDESEKMYQEISKAVVEKGIPAGSDGLVALPYFMGERTPIWDENASGVFVGLSLRHGREHLYRALLESTAYALRHIMESMAGSADIDKIILVGGGARSELWKTIFADVTGKPIWTVQNPVEAPLGDAFLAAINAKAVTGFASIRDWIDFHPQTHPEEAIHQRYNEYYQVYKGLYGKLKEDMKQLKQLSAFA